MNNTQVRIYLFIWVFVGALAGFQIYIMSRILWLLPLIILLPLGFYYYGMHWFHAYEKRRKWSVTINYIWVSLHYLPLIFQILGIRNPNIDTIILAAFGTYLYIITRPHSVSLLKHHSKKRRKYVRKKKT